MKILLIIFFTALITPKDLERKLIITDTVEYFNKPSGPMLTYFLYYPDSIIINHYLPLENKRIKLIRINDIEYIKESDSTVVTLREEREDVVDIQGHRKSNHYLYVNTKKEIFEVRFNIIFQIERNSIGEDVIIIDKR